MSEGKWTEGNWSRIRLVEARKPFAGMFELSNSEMEHVGYFVSLPDARLAGAAPEMAEYIRQRAEEGDAEAQELWMLACEGRKS